MSERYLVRCTADAFNRLQGCFAARVTRCGMIAAHKIERAASYETHAAAARTASQLSKKFSGTTWEAFHA